jgi:flagellar protein FlaJ
MLYGMTASMTFLMFFGLYVVEQFANLFQEVTMPEESAMEPLYFFQEALVHIPVLWTVMWVVLVIHCLISALMVKSITGGHRIGAGVHFVGMMWTATITAVIVMYAAQFLVL